MRKAAIVVGILVILVLGGLFLAPQLVDVDRFKSTITAELTRRTGRAVEIGGALGLSLLPTPTLTARDVRLANPPGAAVPNMVRLRALDVKLALLPLISGRIEVRRASLVEPEIDLERLPDGTPNWRFLLPPPRDDGALATPSPGRPASPFAIDRLSIQNAAVTYRTGSGPERFEHISATVALDERGAIAATGNLVARGAALSFDLRSGAVAAPEVPLQLTLTTLPKARLQLDGQLSGPPDDRSFAGKLKLTADDTRAALATLAQRQLPAALAQPLSVSADVAGTVRALTLDHLAFDFGTAHGEGRLNADLGDTTNVSLKLAVARLDFDRWPQPRNAAQWHLPSPLAGAFAAAPAAGAPQPSVAAATRFRLPDGVNASIDIGADAVLWRGALMRDARLKLALAGDRFTVQRFALLLPGGSDLSLSGAGTLQADGPHGEGTFEADADDLRSLLAAFGAEAGEIPADRLRKAALSGRFAITGDRLDLPGIDATLDATRLNGAATILLRERSGIGLRVAADRFNLDAYLPTHAAPAMPQPGPPPAGVAEGAVAKPEPAPTAAPPAPAGLDSLLTAVDVNLDAQVRTLTWRGQPLGEVHLAATLQRGEATIRELGIADAAGAKLNLSGVVQDLTGPSAGQLAFDMHGDELDRLLRLVAPSLAGRSFGAFSLGGGMQYDPEMLTVDIDAQLLGGHEHVVGDIARAHGTLDIAVELEHASGAELIRALSPLYRPAGGDPGPVKLTARLTGDHRRFTLEHVALALGQSTLAGQLAVDLSGPRPRIGADVTIGDWVIDRLLPARETALLDEVRLRPGIILAQARIPARGAAPAWSTMPLDLGLLQRADLELKLAGGSLTYAGARLDQPAISASLRDGMLQVAQLTGTIFGGSIEASGALAGSEPPALRSKIALRNADLQSALLGTAGSGIVAGRFDLDADVATTGHSAAELMAQLDGAARLVGHDGSIAGVDLSAINQQLSRPTDLLALLRSGVRGRTPYSHLEGSFALAGGVAKSDDLQLAAAGGEGRASASLDLAAWSMASRVDLRLADAPDAPPLTMRLDGAIDAPRVIFDINPLEKYLAAQRQPAMPRP